jgi:fibronectin-binding autotransporter adhesin
MGGGVMNGPGYYDSSGYGTFGASILVVNNCTIENNLAQGGGNGLGGGIANLLSGYASVTDSTIGNNLANGTSGGSGLGGGAYNDATSSLSLSKTEVTSNRADGTPGSGGGIDSPGSFTDDSLADISKNKASTSDNNYGT